MTIPEEQLTSWSRQGAIELSKTTHESIRNAIDKYNGWPTDVTKEVYLQGSYRNDTNIRGDSDVDVVIELTSIFWNNLTTIEKGQLGFSTSTYTLQEFKNSVIDALTSYYGSSYIDSSGSKSIKVTANSGRLKADVVVCATYKYYENLRVRSQGITFWDSYSNQIINYPKIHIENGINKNSSSKTNGWFKPSVRMLKNARNKLVELGKITADDCPSYFIECLTYNVPDNAFGDSYQDCFVNILNYLLQNLTEQNIKEYICQNGMYYLFGLLSVQWNLQSAQRFVNSLGNLWREW